MKITDKTIDKIPKQNHCLVQALLNDLFEINEYSDKKHIYIDWQDYHNEYSPERTDPCPDYYGMYSLRFEDSSDIIGVMMTIEDLDMVLCTLYNFIVPDFII